MGCATRKSLKSIKLHAWESDGARPIRKENKLFSIYLDLFITQVSENNSRILMERYVLIFLNNQIEWLNRMIIKGEKNDRKKREI